MKDANGVKPRGQRVSRAEEPAASRKVARGTPERGVAVGRQVKGPSGGASPLPGRRRQGRGYQMSEERVQTRRRSPGPGSGS